MTTFSPPGLEDLVAVLSIDESCEIIWKERSERPRRLDSRSGSLTGLSRRTHVRQYVIQRLIERRIELICSAR